MDIILVFGLRSVLYIFKLFAEALHCIQHHIPGTLHHYLDDFLSIFPPDTPPSLASAVLEWIQGLGNQLGLSFQKAKTLGPATTVEFLGLELDSVTMEARLPPDKLLSLRDLLLSWDRRSSYNLCKLSYSLHPRSFLCPGLLFAVLSNSP